MVTLTFRVGAAMRLEVECLEAEWPIFGPFHGTTTACPATRVRGDGAAKIRPQAKAADGLSCTATPKVRSEHRAPNSSPATMTICALFHPCFKNAATTPLTPQISSDGCAGAIGRGVLSRILVAVQLEARSAASPAPIGSPRRPPRTAWAGKPFVAMTVRGSANSASRHFDLELASPAPPEKRSGFTIADFAPPPRQIRPRKLSTASLPVGFTSRICTKEPAASATPSGGGDIPVRRPGRLPIEAIERHHHALFLGRHSTSATLTTASCNGSRPPRDLPRRGRRISNDPWRWRSRRSVAKARLRKAARS